jgi:hypothetical protein
MSTGTLDRRRSRYRPPPPGSPVRIAFVGQRTYFETAAASRATPGLLPRFVDFRDPAEAGEMLAAVRAHRPHVVVAFRPDTIPPGAFAALDAAVLGVATEPLPAPDEPADPGLEWNLAELRRADPSNFDRVLCSDPLGWDAVAEFLPAWRCVPLPVDDRFFRPVAPARRPTRAIFIGHSTLHRETYLLPIKHEFDIGHYAYGLMAEDLLAVLGDADVGIVLHGDPGVRRFPPSVLLHLAAGHLVVSEPLHPTFGLEPDVDFVQVEDADEFNLRMHQVHLRPDVYERVRIRGRDKAEQYRAATVWPRIVADLFADLAAFGSARLPTSA